LFLDVLAFAALGLLCYASFILGCRYRDIIEAIKDLQANHEVQPTEVVTSSPRKRPPAQSDTGAFVVTTKSPRQIEKEAKEEVDRIGGIQ
jgi:hypothetical protein